LAAGRLEPLAAMGAATDATLGTMPAAAPDVSKRTESGNVTPPVPGGEPPLPPSAPVLLPPPRLPPAASVLPAPPMPALVLPPPAPLFPLPALVSPLLAPRLPAPLLP